MTKTPRGAWGYPEDPTRSVGVPKKDAVPTAAHAFLADLRRRAERAGVFARVSLEGDRLACVAKGAASHAEYRVDVDGDGVWVSLATSDRWLSQSIEADLMHTGDGLDDLLKEELDELDYHGPPVPIAHYRSDDKLYTFRSRLPMSAPPRPGAADYEARLADAAACLLAYEASFRGLGDMGGGEE